MTDSVSRPDVQGVLDRLKDFQRDTVDYVFRRMYVDPNPTRRFLVADEVGLGKTLVARGLIARVVDHLWDQVDRIDVVYICSNTDIARQNVNRLNIGVQEFALTSRITLLPTTIGNLQQNKVNFVSFTPSTSFDLRSSTGLMQERALLYWLLDPAWRLQGRMAPLNVLQDGAKPENFRRLVQGFRQNHSIDPALAEAFREAIERHDVEENLRARFEDLCSRFSRTRRHIPDVDRKDRSELIGRLRRLLARTCLDALEPDLIILDEFQRFKHLLHSEDQASQLAQELFGYADEVSAARVLLLSATPYKMLTLDNESAEEDHYRDFVDTLRFLQQDPVATQEVRSLLHEYRRALYHLGRPKAGTLERLRAIKSELESQLRQVMVRTERLANSEDRNGMLTEVVPSQLHLNGPDVEAYVEVQRIAQALNQGDVLEYWKSAPYLLNFMEDYKLKSAIGEACHHPDRAIALATVLSESQASLFRIDAWRAYQAIDPRNARLRQLHAEMIDTGLWQLLWLPSALPYYRLGGVFASADPLRLTKRLVFSSWLVAPKVIAALLSYEAERRMMRSFDDLAENSLEARRRMRPLLRFTRTDGRLTGMPVLGLLFPSMELARHLDPLQIAQELTATNGLSHPPALERVLERAERRVEALLEQLPLGDDAGPEDEAWYWAAPALLDFVADPEAIRDWFDQPGIASIWSGHRQDREDEDEENVWAEHVEHARDVVINGLRLGRRPADLVQVLAQLGIAGPGVVALRSLLRRGEDHVDANLECATRNAASRISWGFRSLFNIPEVMALIRSQKQAEPYWRRVLEYCLEGGLQATLDEYVHVLYESLGLIGHPPASVSRLIADAVVDALTLRTAGLTFDELRPDSEEATVSIQRHTMRVRFAIRFGEQRTEDARVIARASQVRTAFNSPFWPFVLATTSIGQEGLDFHPYCHAVVHWNLPANPVDLEQREGRVHRYKGHAVRKNVATRFQELVFHSHSDPCQRHAIAADPWEKLFVAGTQSRPAGASDLVPYWIYPIPSGAQIERHVPALPLSRDLQRLNQLRRSLTVYRLAFGQPRQEDLLGYLITQVPGDEVEDVLHELQLRLSPPRVHALAGPTGKDR